MHFIYIVFQMFVFWFYNFKLHGICDKNPWLRDSVGSMISQRVTLLFFLFFCLDGTSVDGRFHNDINKETEAN